MRVSWIGWVGVFAGCAGAGLGPEVKQDVQMQLEIARPGMTSCYAQALSRSRKIAGDLLLEVRTEPKSGRFSDVKVVQSDISDAELQTCVVTQVQQLTLAKPTKTSVALKVPVRLAPIE